MNRTTRLFAALWLGLSVLGAAAAPGDTPVKTAPLKRQAIMQTIPMPGTLQAVERVMLYAKVTGYLAELRVDVGDKVKAGDVLAVLNIPEMEPQLALANANIAVAKAELERAMLHAELKKLTHRRLADLRAAEAGAVAQQDIDVAKADVQTAQSSIGVAQARLQVAEADVIRLQRIIDYATITAPFSGTITRRLLDTGALVVAGGSNALPLVELMRTDKLELAFDIPERVCWFVGKGQNIQFTLDAIPFKPFTAAITRVSGSLRTETRSMAAEVEIDNPDGRLGPGMYATVRIPCAGMENVAAVPSAAIRSVNGRATVFVIRDGLALEVPVVVLVNDGKEAVIGGELGPHNQVIVSGAANLQDGQRVAEQVPAGDGRNS